MASRNHTRESDTLEFPEKLAMESYSLRLMELCDLLLEPHLDDDYRILYEEQLANLISVDLKVKKGIKHYPLDYLSRVLMDNYLLLLKLATLYFNLSLSSLITKFLVKVFYSLECWELYHLIYIIPNLEYILKLLEFDVKLTSFGYILKPPSNYLNFNLRQGLQYPVPFPFYNFSHHTLNPESSAKRFQRVSIKPYIDIRLNKETLQRKKVYSSVKSRVSKPSKTHSEPARIKVEPIPDFDKPELTFLPANADPFVIVNEKQIEEEYNKLQPQERDEDYEYDSESAVAVIAAEVKLADKSDPNLIIVPSIYQRALYQVERRGVLRLESLHQCDLIDPVFQIPCLKVFYGRNELLRHQEFVHATKKKIYRCQYCLRDDSNEQCYPRHDSLARHIRRKHGITGKENKMAVLLAKRNADYEEQMEAQGNKEKSRINSYMSQYELPDNQFVQSNDQRISGGVTGPRTLQRPEAPHEAINVAKQQRYPALPEGSAPQLIPVKESETVTSGSQSTMPINEMASEYPTSQYGKPTSWIPQPHEMYHMSKGLSSQHESSFMPPQPQPASFYPYLGYPASHISPGGPPMYVPNKNAFFMPMAYTNMPGHQAYPYMSNIYGSQFGMQIEQQSSNAGAVQLRNLHNPLKSSVSGSSVGYTQGAPPSMPPRNTER